ncbi:EAL domain-containing protein [Oribacterium sp. P6A1]|uniref:EAL domain-containing protein n=1 Tax=Oribacterium sp. P6A1 TaxID=1410612 RepID=UPI0009DDF75C|nr:EAL domain-containing protein [Oribacterium sp. P6A1]
MRAENIVSQREYSKSYMFDAIKAIPGGLLIHKADWSKEEILFANDILIDEFDCESKEEFLEYTGGTFKGVIHPEDYESVKKSIRKHISNTGDEYSQIEFRIITKKGTTKQVEAFGRYYLSPAEGPLFNVFLSFPVPITEKPESEQSYILSNIDRAISEGWIEPYYQPIIRTFSGKLCSVEALARWDDPELGMISPGKFIPVLEENGLSYKLDMYIAQRVISMLQQRTRQNLTSVQVSINISRSDFEYCDPVGFIAAACDAHGVRRSLIAIEITETAVISDSQVMKDAINRFHKAGFEVLMDDFGSGYSSLNILKDFDFDEIKIDMGFLRNFDEKSKTIVTMAVRMAKSLGIHTLAEGVETREHVEFLKEIGCERIQGYFYGKPLSLADSIEHLSANGIIGESREEYTLYQKIGLIDVVTDNPLALFFYDGNRFDMIFRNVSYLDELPKEGDDEYLDKYIDDIMNSEQSTYSPRFRSLADKAVLSEKGEFMTFLFRGRYLHFSFKLVAKSRNGVVLSAVLDGKIYNRIRATEATDNIIRNLSSVYECIYVLDLKNKLRLVVVSNVECESEGDVISGDDIFCNVPIQSRLYDKEEEKWNEFANKDYIIDRIKKSGRGFFSDYFLMKRNNGNYLWMELMFLFDNKTDEDKLVFCIKPAAIENLDSEGKKTFVKRVLEYGYLELDEIETMESFIWKSILDESNLKMFWKDTNRRFLGATRAFYNYYGYKSGEEILGKTDEEIGWHLNDAPFESDEIRILTKGESILNATTINVVDGVTHHIIASKIPVYKDNQIIGLVGYMVDADYDVIADGPNRDNRYLDPVTGLMNVQGLMTALSELDNNYRTNGENYIYIALNIEGYSDVLVDYGGEVAMKLLKKMADVIKNSFSSTAVISRNEGAHFGICERGRPIDVVFGCISECMAEVNDINEADGRECRLVARFGAASGSEATNFQSIIELANNRIRKARRFVGTGVVLMDETIPDPYTDIPLPGVMVRPRLDKTDNKPMDMVFIFVNNAYCEMTGKSRNELLGHGYLETFPQTDKSWIDMTYKACKGEYVKATLYDGATHHWLKFTASPTEEPNACFVICDVVDEEMRGQKE